MEKLCLDNIAKVLPMLPPSILYLKMLVLAVPITTQEIDSNIKTPCIISEHRVQAL